MSLGSLFASPVSPAKKTGAKKGSKAATAATSAAMAPPAKITFADQYASFMNAVEMRAEELHNDKTFDMKSLNLRYSTAVKLGKLAHKSIVVIGVGGIGTWVVRNLVGMGATNISIVDYDVVEAHNVGPQSLNLIDLGRPKVDAVHDSVLRQCFIKIQKHNIKVEDFGHLVDILGGTPDVVISAVDSMELRNKFAASLMMSPLVTDLLDNRVEHTKRAEYINTFPELFINTAMGLGVWNTFAMPLRALYSGRTNEMAIKAIEEYHKVAVFPPSEAVEEPCTERAIVYTGCGIASYVCALLHQLNDHPTNAQADLEMFMDLSKPGSDFKWLHSFNSRHHVSQTQTPFQMRQSSKVAAAGMKAMILERKNKNLLGLLQNNFGEYTLHAPDSQEERGLQYKAAESFLSRELWENMQNSVDASFATLQNVGKMVLLDNSKLAAMEGVYTGGTNYLQPGRNRGTSWSWKDRGYTWAFVLGNEISTYVVPTHITEFEKPAECIWVIDECRAENMRLVPASMVVLVRESTQKEKDTVADVLSSKAMRPLPKGTPMPWELKIGDIVGLSSEAYENANTSGYIYSGYLRDSADRLGLSKINYCKRLLTVDEPEGHPKVSTLLPARVTGLTFHPSFVAHSDLGYRVDVRVGSRENNYQTSPMLAMLDVHKPRIKVVVPVAPAPEEAPQPSEDFVLWFDRQIRVGSKVKLTNNVFANVVEISGEVIKLNTGDFVGSTEIKAIISDPKPVATGIPSPTPGTPDYIEIDHTGINAVVEKYALHIGQATLHENDLILLTSGEVVRLDLVEFGDDGGAYWNDLRQGETLPVPLGDLLFHCTMYYTHDDGEGVGTEQNRYYIDEIKAKRSSVLVNAPDTHEVAVSDWVYHFSGSTGEELKIDWACQPGFVLTPGQEILVATINGANAVVVNSFKTQDPIRLQGAANRDYTQVEFGGYMRSIRPGRDQIIIVDMLGGEHDLRSVIATLEPNSDHLTGPTPGWLTAREGFLEWLRSDRATTPGDWGTLPGTGLSYAEALANVQGEGLDGDDEDDDEDNMTPF